MVNLSPAYQPVIIRGLRVHKDNPFLFDFIVDVGQDKLSGDPLKKEGEKLIKYFLASMAIADKDVWVNLSPYEKDKMIPQVLGQTELGRDLLAQDYILKQITASLIYPEKQLGKSFWDKVYAKAQAVYGKVDVPVNTFNKVWIMADKAEVFERNQTAFVVDSHLKVMLEEDYLAMGKHSPVVVNNPSVSLRTPEGGARPGTSARRAREAILTRTTNPKKIASLRPSDSVRNDTNALGSQIVREIVLPELEKEVNSGKNFANLRQIFNSIILSSWYKRNLKEALLTHVYANQGKVKGIDLKDPTVKDQIYQQYLKAYKKGVFNYIKEDINTASGDTIPRKYFSGGFAIANTAAATPAMTTSPAMLTHLMSLVVGLVLFATGIVTSKADEDAAKNPQSPVGISQASPAMTTAESILVESIRSLNLQVGDWVRVDGYFRGHFGPTTGMGYPDKMIGRFVSFYSTDSYGKLVINSNGKNVEFYIGTVPFMENRLDNVTPMDVRKLSAESFRGGTVKQEAVFKNLGKSVSIENGAFLLEANLIEYPDPEESVITSWKLSQRSSTPGWLWEALAEVRYEGDNIGEEKDGISLESMTEALQAMRAKLKRDLPQGWRRVSGQILPSDKKVELKFGNEESETGILQVSDQGEAWYIAHAKTETSKFTGNFFLRMGQDQQVQVGQIENGRPEIIWKTIREGEYPGINGYDKSGNVKKILLFDPSHQPQNQLKVVLPGTNAHEIKSVTIAENQAMTANVGKGVYDYPSVFAVLDYLRNNLGAKSFVVGHEDESKIEFLVGPFEDLQDKYRGLLIDMFRDFCSQNPNTTKFDEEFLDRNSPTKFVAIMINTKDKETLRQLIKKYVEQAHPVKITRDSFLGPRVDQDVRQWKLVGEPSEGLHPNSSKDYYLTDIQGDPVTLRVRSVSGSSLMPGSVPHYEAFLFWDEQQTFSIGPSFGQTFDGTRENINWLLNLLLKGERQDILERRIKQAPSQAMTTMARKQVLDDGGDPIIDYNMMLKAISLIGFYADDLKFDLRRVDPSREGQPTIYKHLNNTEVFRLNVFNQTFNAPAEHIRYNSNTDVVYIKLESGQWAKLEPKSDQSALEGTQVASANPSESPAYPSSSRPIETYAEAAMVYSFFVHNSETSDLKELLPGLFIDHVVFLIRDQEGNILGVDGESSFQVYGNSQFPNVSRIRIDETRPDVFYILVNNQWYEISMNHSQAMVKRISKEGISNGYSSKAMTTKKLTNPKPLQAEPTETINLNASGKLNNGTWKVEKPNGNEAFQLTQMTPQPGGILNNTLGLFFSGLSGGGFSKNGNWLILKGKDRGASKLSLYQGLNAVWPHDIKELKLNEIDSPYAFQTFKQFFSAQGAKKEGTTVFVQANTYQFIVTKIHKGSKKSGGINLERGKFKYIALGEDVVVTVDDNNQARFWDINSLIKSQPSRAMTAQEPTAYTENWRFHNLLDLLQDPNRYTGQTTILTPPGGKVTDWDSTITTIEEKPRVITINAVKDFLKVGQWNLRLVMGQLEVHADVEINDQTDFTFEQALLALKQYGVVTASRAMTVAQLKNLGRRFLGIKTVETPDRLKEIAQVVLGFKFVETRKSIFDENGYTGDSKNALLHGFVWDKEKKEWYLLYERSNAHWIFKALYKGNGKRYDVYNEDLSAKGKNGRGTVISTSPLFSLPVYGKELNAQMKKEIEQNQAMTVETHIVDELINRTLEGINQWFSANKLKIEVARSEILSASVNLEIVGDDLKEKVILSKGQPAHLRIMVHRRRLLDAKGLKIFILTECEKSEIEIWNDGLHKLPSIADDVYVKTGEEFVAKPVQTALKKDSGWEPPLSIKSYRSNPLTLVGFVDIGGEKYLRYSSTWESPYQGETIFVDRYGKRVMDYHYKYDYPRSGITHELVVMDSAGMEYRAGQTWNDLPVLKSLKPSTTSPPMNSNPAIVTQIVPNSTRGGIDLNTSSGMQWKIRQDGKGVEMTVSPAMIARVRKEGIGWLSPFVYSITPITSVWPLVGLKEPS